MKNSLFLKKHIALFVVTVLTISALFLPLTSLRAATLTNGMNAAYVIGNGSGSQDFTDNTSGTTASTFNQPRGVLLDSTNNRLFVADGGNHRVLVFNTDSNGLPLDYTADAVLGQADFTSNVQTTTISGMDTPHSLAYDPTNDRLFVSMTAGGSGRTLVYDVSTINDGEDAIYVLGQADFTAGVVTTTQSGVRATGPDILFDDANDILYMTDKFRVLVFDLSGGITNGMNAANVLGKPNFTSETIALNASTTGDKVGHLALDSVNNRLFLNDSGYLRILVFDVSTITDGEAAVNVLGQPDFTTSASGTTAGTLSPFANQYSFATPSYDDADDRLFVTDTPAARILVFDTSTITNGENAINVLGQTDFVTGTTGTTQSKMNLPFFNEYDSTNKLLYQVEYGNNRVLIWDLTPTVASSDGWNYVHPPLCNAQFSPDTITQGESTTLSWNITWPTDRRNTYYAKVPTEGLFSSRVNSIVIQPEETTTYRIAIFNLWGANFCEDTITVLDENGEEVNPNAHLALTAGVSNSPVVKALKSFLSSLFVR